jgi:hypothetical protein
MHASLLVALTSVFLLVPAVLHQNASLAAAAAFSDLFAPLVAAVGVAGVMALLVLSSYERMPEMDTVAIDFRKLDGSGARRLLLPLMTRVIENECVVL